MLSHSVSKRGFIRELTIGAGGLLVPWPVNAAAPSSGPSAFRFGVITDVHQDIMHDSEQRLSAFIQHVKHADVDFILQMGDFCTPIDQNRKFLEIWHSYVGPRYHVLGNHDTDGGFTRQQAMAFLNMPARYYSFDHRGVHFMILDGNDPGPGQKPYYRYVGDDQAAWLARDLAATDLPVLVFIHQPIDHEKWGIENHARIRALIESAKNGAVNKVVACLSGHLHRNYCRVINEIPYVQINSAAYFWIGPKFPHARYSAEIEKVHPAIKNTVPYKEPLWAIVTIDFGQGIMAIEGRSSEFVGPSPWELGADRIEFEAETVSATISDRRLALSKIKR